MPESIYEKILREVKVKPVAHSVAQTGHKKRVVGALAKKQAERAISTTAKAVGAAVEAKPAAPETFEFKVKAPKAGAKYGRAAQIKAQGRAQARFQTKVAGKEIRATRQAISEAFKPKVAPSPTPVAAPMVPKAVPKPSLASRAASVISKGKYAGVGRVTGKLVTEAVKRVPILRHAAFPAEKVLGKFLAKRALGPAGTLLDIAHTAQAGYEGTKMVRAGLHMGRTAKHAKEKYGVKTKRPSLATLFRESFKFTPSEDKLDVKVWNPKTKRWD